VTEHCAAEIIKTSWRLRRIAKEIRVTRAAEGAQTRASGACKLPKTLNARVFVPFGEFHSARKRASGGARGMRDAGSGGEGFVARLCVVRLSDGRSGR
jgi:hypothetical protein